MGLDRLNATVERQLSGNDRPPFPSGHQLSAAALFCQIALCKNFQSHKFATETRNGAEWGDGAIVRSLDCPIYRTL